MPISNLSPECAYATKGNVKYPGSSAQATAAITAASARLTDAYPTLTVSANAGSITVAT